MDVKQNPFSLYDFLGYFTPGALFIYGCIAINSHLSGTFNLEDLALDKTEIYIPFILLAYTIGHLLSFLSSVTVENYSIWSIGYPSKFLLRRPRKNQYFDVGRNSPLIKVVIRGAVAIFVYPVCLLDVIVGEKLGARALYGRKLDRLLLNLICTKLVGFLSTHTGMKNPPSSIVEDDYFRFVYHWAVEHAPNHLSTMKNYVALYGFLRTLTFLSIFLFWGIVFHVVVGDFSAFATISLLISSVLLSFILYLAFLKFYRRFTLEAFMALCATFDFPEDIDLNE